MSVHYIVQLKQCLIIIIQVWNSNLPEYLPFSIMLVTLPYVHVHLVAGKINNCILYNNTEAFSNDRLYICITIALPIIIQWVFYIIIQWVEEYINFY